MLSAAVVISTLIRANNTTCISGVSWVDKISHDTLDRYQFNRIKVKIQDDNLVCTVRVWLATKELTISVLNLKITPERYYGNYPKISNILFHIFFCLNFAFDTVDS